MTEMGIATATHDLGPTHEEAPVFRLRNACLVGGCVETRPARTGIKFCFRGEQLGVAAHTPVGARCFAIMQFTGKRPFRAFLAGDVKLRLGELVAPLGVGFLDSVERVVPRLFRHDASPIGQLLHLASRVSLGVRPTLDKHSDQRLVAAFTPLPGYSIGERITAYGALAADP